MSTKKPKSTKPMEPRVERGRYARLLSDGYVVEVTPAAKPKDATSDRPRPRPARMEGS